MAIFGIKMAIWDFKMALQLSENIFILMAAIYCTSNLPFNIFTVYVINFQSLKCRKGLKMAILGINMAILGFKMANSHLNGGTKLYQKLCFQPFSYIFNPFSVSQMLKRPKNGHFLLENGPGALQKYFHLNVSNKLYQ